MKKLLSTILTTAMIIAMIPYSVMANTGNTVINVVNVPGYQANVNHNSMVVTPEIQVVSGATPAGYKYQWYAGDDGEYILPWETESSLTIHSQLPAGWLWVEVTPLDAEGNAIGDSKKVKYISAYPMKGKSDTNVVTTEQSNQYANTPIEYLFEVDGVKLILLDRLYNGQYYVMMENSVGGTRAFDTRGEQKAFDPAAPENIGYWLNNDFLNGNYLPDSVKEYITQEQWTTEGDHSDWGNSFKTYKVGLLSYSEYNRYLGRFGLLLAQYDSSNMKSWEGFWFRTLRNGTKAFASAKNGGTDNGSGILGNLAYFTGTIPQFVRPTFRLSADFFTETKIDLTKAGEKVKNAIADCGLNELEGIYTREELIQNGIIKKPVVKDVNFKGNFAVGDTVEFDYIWSSENKSAEGNSSYGFSVSDTRNGPYTEVLTNSNKYEISSSDMGKYLTFYVIPCDVNGVSGEIYRSKPVLISQQASVIVTDSSLSGQILNITLKNLTEDVDNVTVMAATYDAQDNLTGCYAANINVPANDTLSVSNLSLGSASFARVKVMVWDSFEGMNSIYLSDM